MLNNMSGLMPPLFKMRGFKAQTQPICYSLPQTGCVSAEQTVVKQFAFIMPICTSNLWRTAGLVLLCSVLPISIHSALVNGHYSNFFQLMLDCISDPKSHLFCNLLECSSEIGSFQTKAWVRSFSALMLLHFKDLNVRTIQVKEISFNHRTFCGKSTDCSFSCQKLVRRL